MTKAPARWDYSVKEQTAQFHAFILSYIIGVQWGTFSDRCGMNNPKIKKIITDYLTFTCENGSDKIRILDKIRYLIRTRVKEETKIILPNFLPRKKRAFKLEVPEELKEANVKFDINLITELKNQMIEITKENVEMNTKNVEVATTPNKKTALNFNAPPGVDLNSLTLENYRDLTSHRFRMSQDQKSRGLTRQQAFDETKALALRQLQETKTQEVDNNES